MRTYAEKPKVAQHTTSPNATVLAASQLGYSPEVKVNSILHLQRMIGNQAAQRLLQSNAEERNTVLTDTPSPQFRHDFCRIPIYPPTAGAIQAKPTINKLEDADAQVADRVVEQVMRMPEPKLRRTCACGGGCPRCQTEEPRRLQTRQVDSTEAGQIVAPPIVEEALANGGGSLPDGLRADMEHHFAHDFSNVRIHTHARAAESAAAVGARAYTVGRDIAFAVGEFTPYTIAGRRLIAHELAHVVQQHGARLSNARAGIMIGASNDPLEREADVAAQRANEGATPGIASASLSAGASRVAPAPALQRDGGPGEKKEETQLPRVPYLDQPANEKQSQEDESEKGPVLVPASLARPMCDPKGLKRKDYLAQPNTSTDDFGLTRFSGAVSMALPTRKIRGGVALEPLQVALPPITSVFTTADTFIEGTVVSLNQGGAECPSGKAPMQWRIWPTGAAKIREGELEHCKDLQYAYDVTFGWYAQVVDRLIAKGQTFPNEAAAYKLLKKLTGADPTNWPSIFSCLIKKTELRDGKKFSNGWHTPQVKGQPPRLDDSCNFSRVYITGASNFPELGKHPTPSIITGCGESPDAVKAVAAKAAAANTSAGSGDQQEGKPGELPPKTPEPPPKSPEPGR